MSGQRIEKCSRKYRTQSKTSDISTDFNCSSPKGNGEMRRELGRRGSPPGKKEESFKMGEIEQALKL